MKPTTKLGTITDKYRCAAHSICSLKYSIPKVIPFLFHSRSNYDYHFVIKQLPNDFKAKFNCPDKNTENPEIFSVTLTKKVKKINKNGE